MQFSSKALFAAAAAAMGAFALSACATAPAPPKGQPLAPFVLERDLAGKTIGRGSFRAIGRPDRPFVAYLSGTWDGQSLVLVEDFEFSDGEKDRKTWRLRQIGPTEWRGTREDVIGEARGYMEGEAFRLEYDVLFPDPKGGNGTRLRFRDVIVRTQSGKVLNDATVGFMGFLVGGVSLTIERAP
jgi:hypothetical protein